MSRNALLVILALVVGFAGFQTWLNHEIRKVNDDVTSVCLKPAVVPRVQQVFYFPPKVR